MHKKSLIHLASRQTITTILDYQTMLDKIETIEQLENVMSFPTTEVVNAMSELEGDLLILGAGGKMGPTLAKLAKRAIDNSNQKKKVIGVSRFSTRGINEELKKVGIETIICDLLDDDQLFKLPDTPNVIFMASRKFGSSDNESLTWAMNTYLPGRVAQKYKNSKIIVFSTGNVYPFTMIANGGSQELGPVDPIGEYAQSCLGRERIFEHFSNQFDIPITIVRLNYAIDLRYGILLDVAQKVANQHPIDLTMGNVNVIWQGDANAIVLRTFSLCQSPPVILNLSGPETVSIRHLANRFGEIFNVLPIFESEESETSLLTNTSRCQKIFGYPQVNLDQMVEWVAHWVKINGMTLNKPTKFEIRDGRF